MGHCLATESSSITFLSWPQGASPLSPGVCVQRTAWRPKFLPGLGLMGYAVHQSSISPNQSGLTICFRAVQVSGHAFPL